MFYWKIEGLPPLNGLNMYKPSDPDNAGVVLKLGPLEVRMRYSKRIKHFFFKVLWTRRTETQYSI
jgi:hypothetical protein